MNTGKLKRFITKKLESELSEKLIYHGVPHTLYVIKICNRYIKRMHIEPYDAYLLRTAAIMHDTGYLWHFDNHEADSIEFAKQILPGWNYSASEIEKITGMILATKKLQQPKNVLEQIIADADLDYLGTSHFYKIGDKLYRELLAYNIVSNEMEWDKLQVNFLKEHRYHTPFAKKHREPVKNQYIKEIQDKWGW